MKDLKHIKIKTFNGVLVALAITFFLHNYANVAQAQRYVPFDRDTTTNTDYFNKRSQFFNYFKNKTGIDIYTELKKEAEEREARLREEKRNEFKKPDENKSTSTVATSTSSTATTTKATTTPVVAPVVQKPTIINGLKSLTRYFESSDTYDFKGFDEKTTTRLNIGALVLGLSGFVLAFGKPKYFAEKLSSITNLF